MKIYSEQDKNYINILRACGKSREAEHYRRSVMYIRLHKGKAQDFMPNSGALLIPVTGLIHQGMSSYYASNWSIVKTARLSGPISTFAMDFDKSYEYNLYCPDSRLYGRKDYIDQLLTAKDYLQLVDTLEHQSLNYNVNINAGLSNLRPRKYSLARNDVISGSKLYLLSVRELFINKSGTDDLVVNAKELELAYKLIADSTGKASVMCMRIDKPNGADTYLMVLRTKHGIAIVALQHLNYIATEHSASDITLGVLTQCK